MLSNLRLLRHTIRGSTLEGSEVGRLFVCDRYCCCCTTIAVAIDVVKARHQVVAGEGQLRWSEGPADAETNMRIDQIKRPCIIRLVCGH